MRIFTALLVLLWSTVDVCSVLGTETSKVTPQDSAEIFTGEPADSQTRVIRCDTDSVDIENSYYTISDDDLEPYENDTFTIISCPPPRTSYSDVLNKIGINVNLNKLELEGVRYPLNGSHFAGLKINELELRGPYITTPMPNFLEQLPSLKLLSVFSVDLPTLSESFMEEAVFFNGNSEGPFGSCNRLQTLELYVWTISKDHWLESCPKLKSLRLSQMSESDVLKALSGAKYLKDLTIIQSPISTDLSFYINNLEMLMIDQNQVQDDFISNDILLPHLQKLVLTSNNLASGRNFANMQRVMPNLKELDLSENEFDLCDGNFTIEHRGLKILFLNFTLTRSLSCVSQGGLPSLEHLSLMGTRIRELQFQELLVTRKPLTLDLTGNVITKIIFTKESYKQMASSVTLLGNIYLDCDSCDYGVFGKALRDNALKAQGAVCKGDGIQALAEVSPARLGCDKFPCSDCTCRYSWVYNTTEALCTGVTQIPRVKGLNKLLAPYNRIDKLYVEDLPDSLTDIDLAGNVINHIDEQTTKVLFSVKRRIRLAGNPILCDCENAPFIRELHNHKHFVEDYSTLTCNNEGVKYLSDVDVFELCYAGLLEALIAGATVLAIAVIAGVIYCRYGTSIRIFFFARGWCLCCIHEKEDDDDRLFDAFVSFCHTDEAIACELVEKLEEYGYRICVHYREWIPGELIPNQIVRSVEASRRTIVVLSKCFVESKWGLLEFHSAYMRALKEGVARVIAVVIDDVVEAQNLKHLDGDLRSYLKNNTYIRWDDKWFWDRLRYAMPMRRGNNMMNTNTNKPSFLNLNLPAIAYVPQQEGCNNQELVIIEG